MRYRAVPRKAVRYTEATRPDQQQQMQVSDKAAHRWENFPYRDIQQRAVTLGINGKQSREALIAAIEEAENA